MVLLGLASGCVPVPGLGGSSPLARGCRSLLSQGRRGLQRSPAKGSGLCSTLGLQSRSVPALCHVAMKGGMAGGKPSSSRHEGVQEGRPTVTRS